MSRLTRKPTICIGENKSADQLRGNREADQRLCFRYTDSTLSFLLNSEISSFLLFSVLVQIGLCRTCSETTLFVFPRGGSNHLHWIRHGKEFDTKRDESDRLITMKLRNCLPMISINIIRNMHSPFSKATLSSSLICSPYRFST